MDLDADEPTRADDSLANASTNDTNHLVENMCRENGAKKRKARSPSPEGSASSCEEVSPKRPQKSQQKKKKSGKSSRENDNMAMAAINALQKIAGFSKSKTGNQAPDTEDDTDDEIDKPEMINWKKYNVKDNGQDILDMKLRNALKTINAKNTR